MRHPARIRSRYGFSGTDWLAPGLGIAASSENFRLRGPALHWAGPHWPARGLGLVDSGDHRAARAVRRRVAGPHRARHRTARWRNLDWATAQCRVRRTRDDGPHSPPGTVTAATRSAIGPVGPSGPGDESYDACRQGVNRGARRCASSGFFICRVGNEKLLELWAGAVILPLIL